MFLLGGMGPLQGSYNRYARELFNGTFPGIGLGKDGVNPGTTTLHTSSSPSGLFNPTLPTKDATKDVTSTTNVQPTSASSQISVQPTSSSGQSFSSTVIQKTQSSINAAIVATTMAVPKTLPTTSAASGQSSTIVNLNQSVSVTTAVSVSVVVSPLFSATTSSDQPHTTDSGSNNSNLHNTSSSGVIIGATLAGIVFISFILATILCCNRRRGKRSTNESPPERPKLALDTTDTRLALSATHLSPFTITPYHSSPASSTHVFSPLRCDSHSQAHSPGTEVSPSTHGVRRNKGGIINRPISVNTLPVPRVMHWSERSLAHIVDPQTATRDSRILDMYNQETVASQAESRIRTSSVPAYQQNARFTDFAPPANEKDSLDPTSQAGLRIQPSYVPVHHQSAPLRDLATPASEKNSADPAGSFSVSPQQTVSEPAYNVFDISRDVAEMENDPPPAYDI